MAVIDGRKPLTIRVLCSQIGTSVGYWSALENAAQKPGRRASRPGPELLRKAAVILNYPLEEMLTDMGELDGVFDVTGAALSHKLRLMDEHARWILLQAILCVENEQRRAS